MGRLFYVIYYVTGATFFVGQIPLLVFLVLYRHRDGRRATYTHGNTSLEIAWTIAPAILLVILAFVSRKTWADIKQHIPPSDMVIQVTAKQFNWEVAYPGPDGKFDTDDDVVMDNDVHVPVNKTIRVLLKSRDVIHSFFIRQYVFSTDHKMIGKQFLTLGLLGLMMGGILALLVRWELAWPFAGQASSQRTRRARMPPIMRPRSPRVRNCLPIILWSVEKTYWRMKPTS